MALSNSGTSPGRRILLLGTSGDQEEEELQVTFNGKGQKEALAGPDVVALAADCSCAG